MKFAKMSGAGNDFVLVEALSLPRGFSKPKLARRLCSRRIGVGVDGLLIVRKNRGGKPAEVDYYNADGSLAFCGNGSRCAAWWMHRQGWTGRRFIFRTIQGLLEAVVAGHERVRVRMPEVHHIRFGRKILAAGRAWIVHSLNTGVPHVVVEVRNLEKFSVFDVGRAIRRHPAFSPAGTNVDFIRVRGSCVEVRTYERGVENETLACGSGVVASAICAHGLKKLKSPIRLRVRSGDMLKVDFLDAGGYVQDVWLEGPAKIVFDGEIKL